MTARPRLVLYGAGGHGKVVADIVEREGRYALAGFLDDRASGAVYGLPVLGDGRALERLRGEGITHIIVTIGDPLARARAEARAGAAGLELATTVHPSVQVARGAEIGRGSVLMPGSIVGPDVVLGQSCIINTSASVSHDCRLGNWVHVAPGARLGGEVTVGDGAWIGIGATLRPRIRIGAWTLVGAGAAVVADLPENVVAWGVPAEPRRANYDPARLPAPPA